MSTNSRHVRVDFSVLLDVPPRFGETVKLSVGGPLMVVVNADELPPDSDRKSPVFVMYADDMRQVHTLMIPWGLLRAWSPSDDAQVADADVQEEDANFLAARSAVAQADMVARIAVVCDELRKSRDPASFFGLLRSSITDLIQSAAAELDLPGSSDLSAVTRATPECSGTHVIESSDTPPARGTYVPVGCSYVAPGVVRTSDGCELSVGVATVKDPAPDSQTFIPHSHF